MKHIKSLREFIGELERIGDVQAINQTVDWKLEIGGIIRRSYDLKAPAPLFNSISDYEKSGFRVLGAPGSLSSLPGNPLARIALALGFDETSSGQHIMEEIVRAHNRKLIPPVMVESSKALCKENIMLGDDIDLLSFPTPIIHGNDGGRYIQTYGMNIVRTPDGSWTNWSINRMMIVDKTGFPASFLPRSIWVLSVLNGLKRESPCP